MPARRMRQLARGLVMATVLATTAASAAVPPPSVELAAGTLRGAIQQDGSVLFRRIPYAAPPLGALRWRAAAGE